MAKSFRDLIRLCLLTALAATGVSVAIGLFFLLLDRLLGNARVNIVDIFWVNAVLVFLIIYIASIPIFIFLTRKRKGDPFRFSRTHRSYFKVPRSSFNTNSSLLELLKPHFFDCEIKNDAIICYWPRSGDFKNTLGGIYGNLATEVRSLLVRIEGSAELDIVKIELSIRPKPKMRQFDSGNCNIVALSEFINVCGWSKYRAQVNDQGLPLW